MNYRFPARVYGALFILALLGTFFLTLKVPTKEVAGLMNDKVAHALTFFILSFFYSHMMSGKYGWKSLVMLSGLGLLIELIQYTLPWRSFSLLDWLADIAGVMGYHVLHLAKVHWLKRRAKRAQHSD